MRASFRNAYRARSSRLCVSTFLQLVC